MTASPAPHSADGRFAAFWSDADDFGGDTNGVTDVFVRDRLDHVTTRVSVSSAGQGNGGSAYPAISSDGMIVAFQSWAGNFSPGGSVGQVYVRDRRTHTTTLASQSSSGASGDDLSFGARVSGGGRFVAFSSDADNLVPGDTNGQTDVFVRDRKIGTTTLISASSTGGPTDGSSAGVTLSPHGRYVAFNSWADNLVAGDANGVADVFVTDRRVGATTLVSVSSDGAQGNGDSFGPLFASGARFVAYQLGGVESRRERHQRLRGRLRERSSAPNDLSGQCLLHWRTRGWDLGILLDLGGWSAGRVRFVR